MKKSIDTNEAERIVEEAKEQRLRSCSQEIEAALAKYRCQLVAMAQITPDGRIVAMTQIIPRDG